VADMAGRLARHVARAEPRLRVMAYWRGPLNAGERQHSWPLAEVNGDAIPYGFQYVLSRADGDADAVRAAWCHDLVPHLGSLNAVLVIDAVGVPTKGRDSAGVAGGWYGAASACPRSGPPLASWLGRSPRGPRSCEGRDPLDH